MFKSLRARLVLSYLVVIGTTLCVLGVTLTLLLINSPLPVRLQVDQLADLMRTSAVDLRNTPPERMEARLTDYADTYGMRTLYLNSNRAVLFDSAGEFGPGTAINLQNVRLLNSGLFNEGTFIGTDDREWLFASLRLRDQEFVVFAKARPTGGAFSLIGSNLLRPLFQSGMAGLLVALVFGLGISASIAGSLRRVVEGSAAIAEGDYSHRVPEKGPREVRELAHAFNVMSEQVDRTQRTQRDFLANVSHELKTPLTSIQGYSQAILDGAASDPTRAALVIHDEAARMRRMVEDLLELARIESGEAPLRRAHVELEPLLGAVAERLKPQAEAQQVQLIYQPGGLLPRITGDGDRLAQVFTNLIDNALGHTPAGGRVLIEAGPGEGGLMVRVRDSGQGIPAEHLPRIFERFYQVDPSRVRQGARGSGLGLAITREIVEAHGGHIRAESPSGQGASFIVWLPLPRPSDTTIRVKKPV